MKTWVKGSGVLSIMAVFFFLSAGAGLAPGKSDHPHRQPL